MSAADRRWARLWASALALAGLLLAVYPGPADVGGAGVLAFVLGLAVLVILSPRRFA